MLAQGVLLLDIVAYWTLPHAVPTLSVNQNVAQRDMDLTKL